MANCSVKGQTVVSISRWLLNIYFHSMGQRDIDNGYAWVALFGCSLAVACALSTFFAFTVMYLSVAESFDSSLAPIGWIPGCLFGFSMLSSLPAASLARRYGYRAPMFVGALVTTIAFGCASFVTSLEAFFVLVGLVGGVGGGLQTNSAFYACQTHFDKWRSLASGVTAAGGALSGVIVPPITVILMEKYTWRGAMLILAAITFHGAIGAMLNRPAPIQDGGEDTDTESQQKEHEFSYRNSLTHSFNMATEKHTASSSSYFFLFRQPAVIMFSLGTAMNNSGILGYWAHIVNVGVYAGLSPANAAFLPSIMNIVDLCGRLFLSLLFDLCRIRGIIPYIIASIALGILLFIHVFLVDYWQWIVYSGLFGIFTSVILIGQLSIPRDIGGLANYAPIMVIRSHAIAVVAIVTPTLVGVMVDIYGLYTPPLYLLAVLQIVGGLILMPLLFKRDTRIDYEKL